MKCVRFFGFMLFALLASFVFTSLYTADTYAEAPSFDVHKGDSTIFCYNNNTSYSPNNCSDYTYFAVTSVSSISNPVSASFYFGLKQVTVSVFLFPGSSFYLPIPSSAFYIQFDGFNSNGGLVSSSDYFTVTLIDSLSSGITPSGNLDITENGTYDVTQYAQVTVNVENEVVYQDYHEDLVNINHSIIICAATILVLYFFYCIYRMIIKGAGVK